MIQKFFTQESKSIAGAALIIGLSAVVSRVLGLVRDRLLVGRFGVGNDLDAYYAAFQVPNLLFALLVLGVLSAAFIPVFSEYLAHGKREEAWKMADGILSIVVIGMGALCVILAFFAPRIVGLLAPGYDGEKLALTVRLTRVMMLSPFFFAVSAVLSSVLNSFRQFLSLSIAPLLYNLSIIFGITFLSGPFGVVGVAYGAILGAALHVLIQVPAVAALGWRWRFRPETRHPGVRETGRLFLPRVFGIDISQIAQLIGTSIGTTLGAGMPAIFNLAMNVAAVPIGAIAIPFAIAAFPDLSEMAARKDREGFKRVFATTFRQILFFLIPLSALAFVLRVHVIRVVLGASTLAWDETLLASAAFALLVLSLAFQGLVPLLARAFYALKNTRTPVLVSFAAIAVYVGAVAWLLPALGLFFKALMGLGSIPQDVKILALPLAYSIAVLTQACLLLFLLRRQFGKIGGTGLLRAFTLFFAGAVAAVVAALIAERLVARFADAYTFAGVFLQAVTATLAGLAAYAGVLKLGKSEELESVADAIRARLFKVKAGTPVGDTSGM